MKVLVILALGLACAMAQFMPMGKRPHHMRPRPSGGPRHQFGNHMRPTGRPMRGHHGNVMNSEFLQHLKDMVEAWKKSKMSADEEETQFRPMGGHHRRPRPTGRPMGRHPMRPRPSGQPMRHGQVGMNSEFLQHLKDMVEAWKKSKMVADEEETQFRPMGGRHRRPRPTGRPMRPRPSGRPMGRRPMGKGQQQNGMNSEFLQHLKDMVEAWKKSKMAADGDETEIIGQNFGAHFKEFRKFAMKLMANRPTGRPARTQLLKKIHMKFKEAMKKMNGVRPTGRPLKTQKLYIGKLKKQLENIKKQLRQKPQA